MLKNLIKNLKMTQPQFWRFFDICVHITAKRRCFKEYILTIVGRLGFHAYMGSLKI